MFKGYSILNEHYVDLRIHIASYETHKIMYVELEPTLRPCWQTFPRHEAMLGFSENSYSSRKRTGWWRWFSCSELKSADFTSQNFLMKRTALATWGVSRHLLYTNVSNHHDTTEKACTKATSPGWLEDCVLSICVVISACGVCSEVASVLIKDISHCTTKRE